MSSLEKLSIRGIRSFSPEKDEIIEFFHPLTVIVGSNGCGKTTIIECLKVATTGLLPPGAGVKSGQYFIHDPKISRTSEVKACIRLRLRNLMGKTMVIHRTFQVIQSRTSLKFSSMDAAVRMLDNHGEPVSMTYKCADLDKHIPDVMGISRSVLENVIFCHQEESNWPLQDSKTLKKKFDDIFESSRYTKALESIHKLKKKHINDVKELKHQLDICLLNVKTYQEIKDKKNNTNKKINIISKNIQQINDKIQEYEKKKNIFDQEINTIKNIQDNILQKELEYKETAANHKRKYNEMDRIMNESDNELQEILDNYDNMTDEKNNEINSLIEKEKKLKNNILSLNENIGNLKVQKGQLISSLDNKKKRINDRNQTIKDFIDKYDLSIPSSIYDENPRYSDITLFETKFKEVYDAKLTNENNLRLENDKVNCKYQKDISEINARLHHSKEQLRVKEKEKEELYLKRKSISLHCSSSSNKSEIMIKTIIKEMEQRLIDIDSEIEKLKCNDESVGSQYNEKVHDIERAIETKKKDNERLVNIIQYLRQNQKESLNLLAKKNDLKNKEMLLQEKINEINNEVNYSITSDIHMKETSFLKVESLENDLQLLEKKYLEKKIEYDEINNSCLQKDKKRSEDIMEISYLEKELYLLEKKKKSFEENEDFGKLFAVLKEEAIKLDNVNIKDKDELLKNAETILQNLEIKYFEAKEKTVKRRNTILFLNYYKKKGEKDGSCPLCLRSFHTEDEKIKFLANIGKKTDDGTVKEKINQSETFENDLREKWKFLEGLLPLISDYQRMTITEIPPKVSLINVLKDNKSINERELNEEKEKRKKISFMLEGLEEQKEKLRMLNHISLDIFHLKNKIEYDEERINNIKNLNIDNENNNSAYMNMTLEEAENENLLKQNTINQLSNDLIKLRKKKQLTTDLIQNNENEKISLLRSIDNKKKSLLVSQDNRKRLNELSLRINELTNETENILLAKKEELSSKLASVSNEYHEWKTHNNIVENKLKKEISDINEDIRSFQIKNEQIEDMDYNHRDSEEKKLADLENLLKSDNVSLSTINNELANIQKQIEYEKKIVSEKNNFKRTVLDNFYYRSLERKLQSLKNEISNLKQQLNENHHSYEHLDNEIRKIGRLINDYTNEKANLTGRKEQLQETLDDCNKKIKMNYNNVNQKYTHTLIEHEANSMVVSDLDTYYKTLDEALIEYHSHKINEINSIIRDLWQITYRGTDIDTIEIVSSGSDSDEGTFTNATNSRTRNYNYRVVMRKGSCIMEMRGRCSAGQKVIASLVIRLALAEVFCLNCGILTLDEPTTNLDSDNKTGLANALVEIMNAREKQENFQLIVITHDEEFVRILGKAQMLQGSNPGYYFRVSRQLLNDEHDDTDSHNISATKYYSKITKCDWNQQY